MRTLKETVRNLGFEGWAFALTGLTAIIFGILSFLNWLPFDEKQILSILVGAMGLLMTAVIAQIPRRYGEIQELKDAMGLVPKRCAELGILDMWRERENIQRPFWNEFTACAHSEVWLFGIAELGYATDTTFHRIVSDGIARNCRFRILLLDPTSTAAEILDQIEGGRKHVQGRIQQALTLFLDIQRQNIGKPGTVEIRVTADVPHVNIVRSDSELLVTQYMPPLLGYNLFTFRVQKVVTGLFEQYETYFETMWGRARVWKDE